MYFMKNHDGFPRSRVRGRGAHAVACALSVLLSSPTLVQAKDAIRNLGGGLEQLVSPARTQTLTRQSLTASASEETLTLTPAAQFDDAGRVLVRVSFDGKVPAPAVLDSLQKTINADVIASD